MICLTDGINRVKTYLLELRTFLFPSLQGSWLTKASFQCWRLLLQVTLLQLLASSSQADTASAAWYTCQKYTEVHRSLMNTLAAYKLNKWIWKQSDKSKKSREIQIERVTQNTITTSANKPYSTQLNYLSLCLFVSFLLICLMWIFRLLPMIHSVITVIVSQ